MHIFEKYMVDCRENRKEESVIPSVNITYFVKTVLVIRIQIMSYFI